MIKQMDNNRHIPDLVQTFSDVECWIKLGFKAC